MSAVPEEALKAAARYQAPAETVPVGSGFDALEYLKTRGVEVARTKPWSSHPGGMIHELARCIFDPGHTGGSAAVTVASTGAVGYACKHNGCQGRDWRSVREHFDGPKGAHSNPDQAKRSSTHTSVTAEAGQGWPEPLPLGGELPPVDSLTPDMLPVSFRDLMVDVAERMQVPIDFPAASMVICLAGAVNRRAAIQPKVLDSGWQVIPNLWGGIVGRPGFKKSPVIEAVTRPLQAIQAAWFKDHEQASADNAQAQELHALKVNAWKQKTTVALKNNKAEPERPRNPPSIPTCKRLIVVDATVEALHRAMSENPSGLLVLRDELTGWLAQLDKPGREGERAFCLEAWNGTSGFTMDRVGRGTVHVEHVCMSLLGGIQPGRLRSYLGDALAEGPGDDGLMQRFQVVVWPDLPPDWRLVDRRPDARAEATAAEVLRRLVDLPAEDPPTLFRFAPDAQELFFEWYSDIQAKVRERSLHDALAAHLSKYGSLMPSLALLFELADQAAAGAWTAREVTLEHARQAAEWCRYLESHARRVYSSVVSPQMRAAASLAERIKRGALGREGVFVLRDIYRSGWRDLDTPEAARTAVSVLEDLEWIRELPTEHTERRGRPPGAKFAVNPKVRGTV